MPLRCRARRFARPTHDTREMRQRAPTTGPCTRNVATQTIALNQRAAPNRAERALYRPTRETVQR
eukprot:8920900-Lingulodinium_polyedra.AAC.1